MAGMSSVMVPKKRQLPKLVACMTKTSLENARNKALFNMECLDVKGIRRCKMPLHECLILELREAGFTESANYLQDLLYDNMQLVAEDEIGIVTDLRTKGDFLEHISNGLQKAENERDKDNTKKECLVLLKLAMYYAEKGKGILWLAEKFFLAAQAVSSRFMIDGGRLKGVCKYFYATFLLDKFPGSDPDEPYDILTEVRDNSIGKTWPLYEPENPDDVVPPDALFCATAIQLHRVLLTKARSIRKADPGKAERLARLAERRAKDANDDAKTAEAILEVGICQLMMNNLNNALKTFDRTFKIYTKIQNVDGLCETRMHLAAVMQRLGEYETAARLLTEMGALAMDNGLRRQLGRALHLLGELHLRRERPELGTQHLSEAFSCFMGFGWCGQNASKALSDTALQDTEELGLIYKNESKKIYEEEAEQARLMMAISAGQELMASYFSLIREAATCSIAKVKTMEWKLSHASWWMKKIQHELLPCPCPIHNRSPLDILWFQLEMKKQAEMISEMSAGISLLGGRFTTMDDFKKYQSTLFDKKNDMEQKQDDDVAATTENAATT